MGTMFGWSSEAAERLSLRKRRRNRASLPKACGSTLRATVRSRPVSVARHTSPMPPRAINDSSRYPARTLPGPMGTAPVSRVVVASKRPDQRLRSVAGRGLTGRPPMPVDGQQRSETAEDARRHPPDAEAFDRVGGIADRPARDLALDLL